jgi:hypothetical protein
LTRHDVLSVFEILEISNLKFETSMPYPWNCVFGRPDCNECKV